MFVTELGLYSCILASVYDSLSILREMVAALVLGHSHPEQAQRMNSCLPKCPMSTHPYDQVKHAKLLSVNS